MAEMNDLQARINALADARLQADLDATYPVVSNKFDYCGRVPNGISEAATKITVTIAGKISLSWSGGLMSNVQEQLREQFRDQYRAEESARFLAEVEAMKTRLGELTGEELQVEAVE